MTKPDFDLLICADEADENWHAWFPAQTRDCRNLIALEGVRFRNVYLTSAAIEHGSASLFNVLYRTAKIMHGKVLHVSDYQE